MRVIPCAYPVCAVTCGNYTLWETSTLYESHSRIIEKTRGRERESANYLDFGCVAVSTNGTRKLESVVANITVVVE